MNMPLLAASDMSPLRSMNRPKRSHSFASLRLATTKVPPPPSAQTNWLLCAFSVMWSSSTRCISKVSHSRTSVRLTTTSPPPPPSAQAKVPIQDWRQTRAFPPTLGINMTRASSVELASVVALV